MHESIRKLIEEIGKVVVGQQEMIEGLLIALLSEGHILIEGVPGLAKTTTVNALSQAMGLRFKRIQFTPDLLPSDITGTQIYNPKTQTFRIKQGPLFANLVLADEINRAPAKVQSALLEAMQERQITIAEETFALPDPFMVMATQNPIEQEGVYPLPEAQLDRFMMKLVVHHNTEEEELEIMRKAAKKAFGTVTRAMDAETLATLKKTLDTIHFDPEVERYIVRLVAATRNPDAFDIDLAPETIRYGASPRASIDLYKAARAKAFLEGKTYVSPATVGLVAHNVLRHRIVLGYEARAKGIDADTIVSKILETVPIP